MSAKKMSYKEAVEELEEILTSLETSGPDVDSMTIKVKRAAELIKFCKGKLFETEAEIEKIIEEIGE
jgi:exodeoxyribonuclease VII small subunit